MTDKWTNLNKIYWLFCTVKLVRAQSLPITTTELEYEIDMFDERGGIFHSANHGVTIVFSNGAIPKEYLVELKFAAMLDAPIKFSSTAIPVSAIYWLCMDKELEKPIQLYLPHSVNIENEAHASKLKFVKFQHLQMGETTDMHIIEGGNFPVGESYGFIEVNHFCYYCIVEDKLDPTDIPRNKYVIAAIAKKQSMACNWEAHICLYPSLQTCAKVCK